MGGNNCAVIGEDKGRGLYRETPESREKEGRD